MQANDPRAQWVLETAYRLLQERASKLEDESTRRTFLHISHHRSLIEAYEGG